ncbi:MAG: hypothetical protein C4533_00380 [Candidatus Omnitrophota bacterium]|jgi:rubrerythrin|nr:MAG: hypothetical protein C4533_00380 [Candidatus Omnitrophota bacterium]
MKYLRKDKFSKPFTASDILNLALEKEKSSYEFYSKIIEQTKNASLLKLLKQLKDAELGHIRAIKALISK